MKMKTLGRMLCQAGLVVIITGVIGFMLLVGAFLLPTERICANVENSIGILTQETDYFSVTRSIPGSKLDNYTEALYLNQAMIGHKDIGLLESVLGGNCYRVEGDLSPVNNLSEVLKHSENATIVSTYNRFFNGYEVAVKAMLMITDYSGIRQFNLLLEFFLSLFLCYLMFKRNLTDYILPVIIALVFINPLTIALNMAFSGFYYCMIIPCIIILSYNKKLVESGKYWVFFEIIGACSFYFNMNYFQLVTFGVPLIFYFLINGFPQRIQNLLKTVALFFSAWFIGYAGMMVFKWVIYAIAIEPDIFSAMFDTIAVRLSTNAGTGDISRFKAIWTNIQIAKYDLRWNLIEAAFVLSLFVKHFAKRKVALHISASDVAFMIIMALLPLVRCFIYANHVYIHAWATYRIFILPVMAFNILIVKVKKENELVKC